MKLNKYILLSIMLLVVLTYFTIVNYFKKDKGNIQYEYFESGEVKMKSELIDDIRNGKTIFYFKNGKIKDEAEWMNGVMGGGFTTYYENGAIQSHGTYKKGKAIGKLLFYYNSGKVREEHNYYNDGNIESYIKYGRNGEIVKKGSQPIFTFADNILKLGEIYNLNIDFTNSVYDSTDVIIGNLTDDNLGLIDTLLILKNRENLYNYSVDCDSIGKFLITGIVRGLNYEESKLVEIEGIPFKMIFYVKRDTL